MMEVRCYKIYNSNNNDIWLYGIPISTFLHETVLITHLFDNTLVLLLEAKE